MALVVITGGARSGKSRIAEQLALSRVAEGTRVTVVVFGRESAGDAEFAQRVARHRADRPSAFETLEAAEAPAWRDAVPADELLLVDCLGTALGSLIEAAWDATATDEPLGDAAELASGFAEACEAALGELLDWLIARRGDTIVVTNEVGDGLVPAYATGRLFRDLLGRANRTLVDAADASYLVVAGRVVALDCLPTLATWPHD